MKKKLILTLLFLTTGILSIYSQEVELKDNKVLLDGKEFLKYEKVNNSQYSFFTLDDVEFLMYKYQYNHDYNINGGKDYNTYYFITAKKKIESSDFSLIYAANSKKNMQKLIKLLLKEKVLDTEGKINIERLDIFYEKYNNVIK